MDSSNSKNFTDPPKESLSQSSLRTSVSSSPATQGHESSKVKALTTEEALQRLFDDISQEIILMKKEFAKRTFISSLQDSISFKSELSKMRWPSVLFMTAQAIVHFIVAFILEVDNLAMDWVGFQGFLLAILLVFNLAVNLWDTKLRFKELLMKSEQILELIERCSKDKHLLEHWKQYNYRSANAKRLFIPKSPCVHQTLAYRDDSCLNLPDYLLVRGDIIHLYPGERAPGDCVSLKTNYGNDNSVTAKTFLREGEIFHIFRPGNTDSNLTNSSPIDQDPKLGHNFMVHAKMKKSNKGTDFMMMATPYIKSLQISLLRSHKRPVNSIEKECFIVSRKYFETYVIPLVFLLSTIVTAIHYAYLDLTDSDQKIKTISIAYLLLRPSLTIMPFLPWMFPCFWMTVNAYGTARLLCCAEAQRKRAWNQSGPTWGQRVSAQNAPITPSKFDNLLATPTAAGSSDQNKHDEEDLQDLQSHIRFVDILKVFGDLIQGKGGHVWRSSSLLQVLGCLTSLCCIDKVGILSWSNPTPEKVFLLTKTHNDESITIPRTAVSSDETALPSQVGESSNQQTLVSMTGEALSNQLRTIMYNYNNDDQSSSHNLNMQTIKHLNSSQTRAEILDVSQTFNTYRGFNQICPIQQSSPLQFDDLNWQRYFSNLKPLGLSILLDNCCEQSFGDYFRFYKHISYESIVRCNLTPVVKRRCMCALSHLIGFSRDVVNNYKYVSQIGVYKLIDPSTIKGKLVTSLENTTRLKLPFPNMTCNVHRDISTGSYQVFSQGTADIVLDACIEFWDGKQLAPLDDSAKKKIMDFYHRTSLTSYCTAFSYTPLIKAHKTGDNYIELPPEGSKFSPRLRKLALELEEEFQQNQIISRFRPSEFGSQLLSSQENLKNGSLSSTPIPSFQTEAKPEVPIHVTRRHLSVDNLWKLDTDSKESLSEINANGKKSSKTKELDAILNDITDQVFVGMVAMQYQACPDFVALVEQLEHACIRFVHFSKENELRSRVFSEKMGLESGWNCHISLQSDQDLDKADKIGASFPGLIAQPCDSPSSNTFVPSTRMSDILLGAKKSSKPSSNRTTISGDGDNDATSSCSSISSDQLTLHSWRSLPSLVMKIMARISTQAKQQANVEQKSDNKTNRLEFSSDEMDQGPGDAVCGGDGGEVNEFTEDSVREEGLDTLAFDMSNRAKLPKGIENIRPHLETVDNIPLQVSLFTDCTPALTKEMIEIMQDYGEIVCVIGSSSSRLNTPIFLQANASIAIEPLLPQTCQNNDTKSHLPMKRQRKESARADKFQSSNKNEKNDEHIEYTAIQITPRPSNPRDRLGIGPTLDTNCQLSGGARGRARQRYVSTSDSSRSSFPARKSCSSSSSSPSSRSSSSEPDNDVGSTEDHLLQQSDSESLQKTASLINELPDPSALASKLASLPCSYSYNRKEAVNLYSLIMEARHFTFKMKNTFVCLMCFALSISSAQFLASILFLPPMLSSGLTIWLTVFVVPLMSFSLMNTTMDAQVMKIAVGKNLQLKPENITFFVICYLIKFIPSIIVVVLSFGLIIAHSCKLTGFGSSSLGPCWMFTYVKHSNTTSPETADEDLLWSTHLLTAQVCAAFLLVLYFVVISSGFVHRSHLVWERSPTRNRLWVVISFILIIGQLFYNQLVLHVNLNSSKIPYEFLASLPLHIWLISFMWPILVIGINLLVKRAEIKAIIRQQRRARFDFNTKLGMNSPF